MKRTETKGNRKNSSRRFTALMLVLFMGLQLLAPAAIEISAMNYTEIVPENAAPAAAPAVQILTDTAAPVAAPALEQGWALINLIAVIAAAIAAAAMILRSKRDDDADRNWFSFTGLIPFIASAMAFILTQNMQNGMVLTDKWTVLMIAILAAQAIIAIMTRENKEEE